MEFISFIIKYIPKPLKKVLKKVEATSVVRRWHNLNHYLFHEPDVCNVIKRIVQPGWVCADVGGNVGNITLLLAELVGCNGNVVAFEAHPGNAQSLLERIKINEYEKFVNVEHLAISDGSCGHLWLYPGRNMWAGEWNVVGHDIDGNKTEPKYQVVSTSLDNYYPPGSCLNFVKIDVEGAEAKVLSGMRRLLMESRPLIIIEFHDEIGWGGRHELFSAGYCLYDVNGRQLDPINDVPRVFHCLAIPKEVNIEANWSSPLSLFSNIYLYFKTARW